MRLQLAVLLVLAACFIETHSYAIPSYHPMPYFDHEAYGPSHFHAKSHYVKGFNFNGIDIGNGGGGGDGGIGGLIGGGGGDGGDGGNFGGFGKPVYHAPVYPNRVYEPRSYRNHHNHYPKPNRPYKHVIKFPGSDIGNGGGGGDGGNFGNFGKHFYKTKSYSPQYSYDNFYQPKSYKKIHVKGNQFDIDIGNGGEGGDGGIGGLIGGGGGDGGDGGNFRGFGNFGPRPVYPFHKPNDHFNHVIPFAGIDIGNGGEGGDGGIGGLIGGEGGDGGDGGNFGGFKKPFYQPKMYSPQYSFGKYDSYLQPKSYQRKHLRIQNVANPGFFKHTNGNNVFDIDIGNGGNGGFGGDGGIIGGGGGGGGDGGNFGDIIKHLLPKSKSHTFYQGNGADVGVGNGGEGGDGGSGGKIGGDGGEGGDGGNFHGFPHMPFHKNFHHVLGGQVDIGNGGGGGNGGNGGIVGGDGGSGGDGGNFQSFGPAVHPKPVYPEPSYHPQIAY